MVILQFKLRYDKKFTSIPRFLVVFFPQRLLVLAPLFAYIPNPLKRQTVMWLVLILLLIVTFFEGPRIKDEIKTNGYTMIKKLSFLLLLLLISNLSYGQEKENRLNSLEQAQTAIDSDFNEIKVLNLGVFHFGITPDNNKTNYNEKRNLKEIKEIAQQIADFKPTIILVEEVPENQRVLREEYQKYLKNPRVKTKYAGGEIQLLAFEIGRLSNTEKIIGIDHKLSYNYNLDNLAKDINAEKYFLAKRRLKQSHNERDVNEIGLKKKLLFMNTEKSYNWLINVNADYLTYANSKNKFEGADEAAKFYKRNLRMFANINKVSMSKDDRVLIISGAGHAAFFQKFMNRSPIYELVDLTKFLK